MIYTVTLNPSVDKTLKLPSLEPGKINRAIVVRQDWGGKGINVSRALAAVGLRSIIVTVLAGSQGESLAAGLRSQGFDLAYIEGSGQTRQNITIYDQKKDEYTKINEPGPTLDPAQESSLLSLVASLAVSGDLWAFCGSLPPGANPDLYRALLEIVQNSGAKAFLDTSGRALKHGLEAKPFGIKPNEAEAGEILARRVDSQRNALEAVKLFMDQGIQLVALTRGSAGLILGYKDTFIMASPPQDRAASPVGAGDAAMAGLIWAYLEDSDPEVMARRAVALGTAAAMQEGTGVGDRALIEEILPTVQLKRIDKQT